MTWGNGTATLLCELCGHEAMPEGFVWYQDELAICQNSNMCAKRQAVNHLVKTNQVGAPPVTTEETIKNDAQTTIREMRAKPAEFLEKVTMRKMSGRSEQDIASEFDLSISQLRSCIAIAKHSLLKEAEEARLPSDYPSFDSSDKNPNKYIDKACQLVVEHYNRNFLADNEELHISEVYVTTFTKTLQNWKALVATEVANDGLYFEVTYNGDKKETYIDTYSKVSNTVITDQSHAEAEYKAEYVL